MKRAEDSRRLAPLSGEEEEEEEGQEREEGEGQE